MLRVVDGNVFQVVIDCVLGEVCFIWVMVYYLLVEYWGEVFIVENFIEIVVSNDFFFFKNI